MGTNEEVVQGLQPGALEEENEHVRGRHKPCQIQTHGDSSMEELPAKVPSGVWDQGGAQTQPPGSIGLASAEDVPPLGVCVGCKGGVVKRLVDKRVELATVGQGEVNRARVLQPAEVMLHCQEQGVLRGLLWCRTHQQLHWAGGHGGAETTLTQDML